MAIFQHIWTPKRVSIVFIEINGAELEFSARSFGKRLVDHGSFESIEALVKKLGSGRPYHLHLSGSGVLTRKVESLPNFKEQLIISGKSDAFHFTSYDDQQWIAVSFLRKALTEEIEHYFMERKLHLLGVSSGEIPLCTSQNGFYKGVYSIEIADGRLKQFEKNTLPNANTDPNALAEAIALNYSRKSEAYSWSQNSSALENFKEFTQFKTIGLGLLFTILFALFGNYLYQNHLNNSVAQLESDLSMSNNNLAMLDRLEQEKSRKKQLIASAGTASPRFLSFYLDEIARTVPKSIDLQELALFPLQEKLKQKQKVDIVSNETVIMGTTPNNMILDDWIELMDRFEWVASIELLNYSKTTEKEASFKLLIKLNQ